MRREHTRDIGKMLRAALALLCALALAVPTSLGTLAAQPHQAWAEDTTTTITLTGAEGEERGSNDGAPTILGIKLTQSFCVTFDTNGASTASTYYWVRDGEALSSARTFAGDASRPTASTGAAVTAFPADPVRDGYSFRGWYATDASGNITGDQLSVSVFNQTVSGNVTYKAKWLVNYTVTFDTDGGSAIASQTVADGEFAKEPETAPVWTDHHFQHWYEQGENPAVPFAFTSTPITGDTTLIARWQTEVKVYFSANGGTLAAGTVSPVALGSGDAVTQPADPTRAGYIFEYWFAGTGTDGAIQAGDDARAYNFGTPVEGLVYLYAKWSPCVYKISYDDSSYGADGDLSVASGTPVQSYTRSDSAITINWVPARDGYGFKGWTAAGAVVQTSPVASITIPAGTTGTIKLTANWSDTTTSIPLAGAEGEETGSNDAAPTTLSIRLKAGDETNDTNTVLVAFYPRNGEAAVIRTMKKGETVASYTPAELTGFAWAGWTTDASANAETMTPFDFAQPLTGDVTLYGCWRALDVGWTHRVTYSVPAYTGSTLLENRADEYGHATPFNIDAADLGIYRIEGYYAASDFSGAPWDFSNDVVTSNMTLYAKCVATVTLHATGGSLVADGWTLAAGTTDDYTHTITFGESLTVPANTATTSLTRTDWAFSHWCTDAALSTPLAGSATATPVILKDTTASRQIKAEYWAAWDPCVTFEFYKYADGEGKYDCTTSIAASDTTTQVTLPSTEPAMADGTAASGLAGHMLTTWYVNRATGAYGSATSRLDVDGNAGAYDLGATPTLAALGWSTATEPVTVQVYAGWVATLGATLSVKTADFNPTASLVATPVDEATSINPITVQSGTSRQLDITAQSAPAGDGYDYTGGFTQSFKQTDGSQPTDAQLQGTQLFYPADNTQAFTYMGASKAAGSTAAVGTVAANGQMTGDLKLKLASGLRTLYGSEVEALDSADGSAQTASTAITRVLWTAQFKDADATHAYLFGSAADTAW